jgi:hypothetical protein
MSPRKFKHPRRALAALSLATAAALATIDPLPADAALKGAAGGATGSGGFTALIAYADKLATYLIALSVPGAVLGAIVVGFLFMKGDSNAVSWAGRLAVGFIIVVGAKGIAS